MRCGLVLRACNTPNKSAIGFMIPCCWVPWGLRCSKTARRILSGNNCPSTRAVVQGGVILETFPVPETLPRQLFNAWRVDHQVMRQAASLTSVFPTTTAGFFCEGSLPFARKAFEKGSVQPDGNGARDVINHSEASDACFRSLGSRPPPKVVSQASYPSPPPTPLSQVAQSAHSKARAVTICCPFNSLSDGCVSFDPKTKSWNWRSVCVRKRANGRESTMKPLGHNLKPPPWLPQILPDWVTANPPRVKTNLPAGSTA